MPNTSNETRLICPLTSPDIHKMRTDMQQAADMGADTIELRIDLLSPMPSEDDVRWLVADAPADIILTCRAQREGGNFTGDEAERLALLSAGASAGAAFVDTEMDVPPADRPAATIIESHHNFQQCPDDLDELVARQDAGTADICKVAFKAAGPQDAFRAFDVIRASRKPTLALAMGEPGLASRILARKFAAFGTFAALESGAESAPGQPTLNDMLQLYRWNSVSETTNLFGVIGCPVGHSMSPAIHNAAFDAAGYDGVYVPLRIEPGADDFNRFMDEMLARPWLDWRGLSVTIPHKENALAYVGAENCDPLAVQIGAVNTITVGADGSLRGDNTDYAGATDALCNAMGIQRRELAGRTVAILGAGGAARALAASLTHYKAHTTVYNRTLSRAEALADEFGITAESIEQADNLDAEIVINCTPLGMHPKTDASPLSRIPDSVKVVFDTIYNPLQTKLLKMACDSGILTVSGLDMFVNQAASQFEIWTDISAPRETMSQVVLSCLSDGR